MITACYSSSAWRAPCCALFCLALLALAPAPALAHASHDGHDHHHDHDDGHHHDGGAEGVEAPTPFSPTAGAISAGVIAGNQQSLADVFSQDSILSSPANPTGAGIRIDFNEVIELNRPDLLSIDTRAEQEALFALTGGGVAGLFSDTLNVYYVDSISACGEGLSRGIVGCASVNGNDLVVESSFAASFQGAELLAHEIAHNLGLPHVGTNSSTDNLLNPRLNGDTSLTSQQALSLLANRRVNRDFGSDELFITINPIVVGSLPSVAPAVPEPAAAGVALWTLLAVSGRGRRRG